MGKNHKQPESKIKGNKKKHAHTWRQKMSLLNHNQNDIKITLVENNDSNFNLRKTESSSYVWKKIRFKDRL